MEQPSLTPCTQGETGLVAETTRVTTLTEGVLETCECVWSYRPHRECYQHMAGRGTAALRPAKPGTFLHKEFFCVLRDVHISHQTFM